MKYANARNRGSRFFERLSRGHVSTTRLKYTGISGMAAPQGRSMPLHRRPCETGDAVDLFTGRNLFQNNEHKGAVDGGWLVVSQSGLTFAKTGWLNTECRYFSQPLQQKSGTVFLPARCLCPDKTRLSFYRFLYFPKGGLFSSAIIYMEISLDHQIYSLILL